MPLVPFERHFEDFSSCSTHIIFALWLVNYEGFDIRSNPKNTLNVFGFTLNVFIFTGEISQTRIFLNNVIFQNIFVPFVIILDIKLTYNCLELLLMSFESIPFLDPIQRKTMIMMRSKALRY